MDNHNDDSKPTDKKIPSALPGSCHFYLTRKNRYCKFPPPNGEKFCVQHLPANDSGQVELKGKKRIPCPLDPNHSVFEYKLTHHLKKCNSRSRPPPAYHIEDINSGSASSEPDNVLLSDVDVELIKDLVVKISRIYEEHIKLTERIKEHKTLQEDLSNPLHQKCLKHRRQEASLLGNMEACGWITDGTAYVEFGAGRARLTSYLLDSIPQHSKSTVLLVDRDTTRNKCENRYKYAESGPSLERLRIDIKDLALDQHNITKTFDKPLVAYSKHLCGAATDLTLRCLEKVIRADSNTVAGKRQKLSTCRVKGIQIALCCHHKCTWTAYVGKQFWSRQGLTDKHFVLTRALSSWATCAFPGKDGTGDDIPDHASMSAEQNAFNRFPFWSSQKREEIGLMSKRVIDIGREHFLQDIGFTTNLVVYVTKDTSLENVMLVAEPASTK